MRFIIFLITGLLCLIVFSCNPCDKLDCIADNYYGQFRIVSKTDGKDLVFGDGSIYDKNNIKFYSIKGTDTIFFENIPTKFPGIGYDSILSVLFYPGKNSSAFIKFNELDTDTLTINYNSFKTKCCGTITAITNFRYNNIFDLPGSAGVKEIRK